MAWTNYEIDFPTCECSNESYWTNLIAQSWTQWANYSSYLGTAYPLSYNLLNSTRWIWGDESCGCKFTYTNDYNAAFSFYYNNEIYLNMTCEPARVNSSGNALYLYVGVDEDNQYGSCFLMYKSGNQCINRNLGYSKLSWQHEMYLILKAGALIVYQWTSVASISGAPGIMALTQITDEGIGEYDQTKIQVSKDNILRFTDGSNIRRLISNIAQNTWTSIGYSGLNYVQINWQESTQYQNTFDYTLRFVNHYGEGNNQYYSTIYEISDSIPYDGTEDMYMGFIIDRENQVAVYDPVLHINNPLEPLTHDTVSYNLYRPTDQQMVALYVFLMGSDGEPTDENDPYATGSTDDGGDGSPDQPQDHLVQNNLPTKGGLNLGMVTLYQPSDTELSNIASYLWDDSVLENFKKYFNNFADNLIALIIMPYTMSNLPTKKFKVGNLESDNPLLAAVSYVTDRYVDIDMGKFSLQRKWDSYLDCAPYTKLEIFLPYCGTHTLDTDEIMYPANLSGFIPAADQKNAYVELSLSYRLDILTGNIVATLSVDGELRYQFTGKCGVTVPLTGANYHSLISTIISAGAGLASTIASGGATAPLIASAAVTGTVMSQKPQVYRSGNFSGDVSALGYDTPYLIKTRPNKPLLEKQELYTGLPSYKKGTLGEFSGYTEVIEAHIDNVSCTSEERDMIMAALKGGVII